MPHNLTEQNRTEQNRTEQIIPEETSRRITSLRFLLMTLVVMIHASLKADNALNYYHLDFVQPYWIEIFKLFFAGILANAAVPLFFLFSSYIQFSKNEKYTTLLKKRQRRYYCHM